MQRNNFSHAVMAALFGALLLVVLQLVPYAADVLRFERATFERGALWLLLTSQLVHLGNAHAALNALAFTLSLLVWSRWISLRHQLMALAGGALGVAMLLVFDADANYYAGLSGALHGLWAGNAIMLMVPQDSGAGKEPEPDAWPIRTVAVPRLRSGRQRLASVILAVLVIKLWAQSGDSPENLTGWLQLPVYRPAHWAGLIGGMLMSVGGLLLRCVALPRK